MNVQVLINSLFNPQGANAAAAALGSIQVAGGQASGSAASMTDSFSGFFSKFGLMVDGMQKAVDIVGGAISKAFAPSIEMETLITQFEVLLGGIDAAKERMEILTDFADKTPFALPEVARASKILETLTHGALATGKGLTIVGDMAAASGQRFDELSTWVGRLYDGLQNERPVGEAMMRLQELGLMSSDVRGKIENMQKAGQKGDAVWNVAAQSFERYTDMMDKQSKTMAGLLSTLGDAFNGLLRVAFGDSMLGSKGPIEFLIKLLGDLKEPLAALIEDAKVFWSVLYGDDAKSFSAWISENALPMAMTIMGVVFDLSKALAGLWEGALGAARLVMSGVVQYVQILYTIMTGIPTLFAKVLSEAFGMLRQAILALPPALRPDGANMWLAQQEAKIQGVIGLQKQGFDALGDLSQGFADDAAGSFARAGFAFGQIGETQGERAPGAKKKVPPKMPGAAAATGGDGSAEDKIAASNDAFANQQAIARAKHEEDLQNKLFEGRSKREKELEKSAEAARAKRDAKDREHTQWMVGQAMNFVNPLQNGLQTGISEFVKTGEFGVTKIGRKLKEDLIDAAIAFLTKMAMGKFFSLFGGGLAGGIGSALTGLPSFDVGTPSLPRDMVAMVHAGEMIPPAKVSAAARAGDFAPMASFLGVQAPAQAPSARGQLVDLDREVVAALRRNGSAIVRIHANAQAGYAGA